MSKSVSVIALVSRDEGDVRAWHDALQDALAAHTGAHEIVYALSDRCPCAAAEVERRQMADPRVRSVTLTHWFDEAAAVQRALQLTSGEVVLTTARETGLAPADLGHLLAALEANDVALAVRQREGRAMPLEAALLDRLTRRLFGAPCADPACRTRAYRRSALAAIADRSVPFSLQPLLASWQGLAVEAVAVHPSAAGPRARTTSVQAAGYLVAALFLYLLLSFAKRPLQLLGLAGALATAAGLAIVLPLLSARLVLGTPLANEPGFIPGLLLLALGVQCGAIGLLAELLVFARNQAIKDYVVERVVE